MFPTLPNLNGLLGTQLVLMLQVSIATLKVTEVRWANSYQISFHPVVKALHMVQQPPIGNLGPACQGITPTHKSLLRSHRPSLPGPHLM